ncbi:hypothetical protein H7J07_06035 [Mycobacterium koreense]|uniref:Uncharacterized protein n=1 Tax=Mycolicibacillus koreensis TaxID=1069220 RepID=A0A7I7SCR7_9MYCO|nr:hypothetical protein [Mycolicibacillus koreensis]MCV7247786.1 hypothetical protein [Mycolicibacillus koreensis]OSC34698.1 hypothetical protein B8W67_05470 [Mycolicibacillus koreensis]BBY54171.1 hypothetical protein MKOR_14220 [Mycolicibacillus koreensis]
MQEATLEQIGVRTWRVVDGDGRELVRLTGLVPTILGPAAASLVADHGYPRGDWVPDQRGSGFRYVPADPAQGG